MQFFKEFGPKAAWLLEIGLISMSIIVVAVTYRQLIPLQVPFCCCFVQIIKLLQSLKELPVGKHIRHKKGVVYKF